MIVFIASVRSFPWRRNCSARSQKRIEPKGFHTWISHQQQSAKNIVCPADFPAFFALCSVEGSLGASACKHQTPHEAAPTWYLCNSITLIQFLKLWSFIQQQPFGSPQINRQGGGGSIGLSWETVPALFGFMWPSSNKDSVRVHGLDLLT